SASSRLRYRGDAVLCAVYTRRMRDPVPVSPGNAPVASTIENEVPAVAGAPAYGADWVSRRVIDPCAVVRVKVSTVERWPEAPTSVARVPVTSTWPRPAMVPEPWKVVVVPTAWLLVGLLA